LKLRFRISKSSLGIIVKRFLTNALIKARKASLIGYVPYHGEEQKEDTSGCDSDESDDMDMLLQYENLQTEMKNKQKMKEFLQGLKFSFRLEGVRLFVFAPSLQAVRQKKVQPSLEFQLNMLAVIASIIQENAVAKVLIKEIKLCDHFKICSKHE